MKFKRLVLPVCLALLFSVFPVSAGTSSLPDMYISEIMASNSLFPVMGKLSDWVELHNAGDVTISLEGMGISDQASRPYKYRLSGELLPGEYLILPCDEEGLGFSLDKEGETLTLTAVSGETLDRAVFMDMEKDTSLVRTGLDGWQTTYLPSPGKANRVMSRDESEIAWFEKASRAGLMISEVLASDIANEFGKPNSDWVEITNPGEQSISLKGYYLSDNALELKKYALPNMSLKPGKSLLVYCFMGEGKEKLRSKYVNTAFEVDRTNGALVLSDGETPIDMVSLHMQYGGISYGRPENQGAFRYFQTPTPQAGNPSKGSTTRLDKVVFSKTGGFVNEAFSLSLSSAEGSLIRYTLDGSEPSLLSDIYQTPIHIDKNTVVRAKCFQEGRIDALTATQTYLFEPETPGIPVVCLAGDEAIFFGTKGLFEKGNEGLVTERTLNVEMYDGDSGQKVNQLSGIRLTGGTSAVHVPRTFTLYARGRLDKDGFSFNPFGDRNYQEYSALTLRHGGTDTKKTRLRDAFLTRLVNGYGVMYLASAPAEVYVNGEYWGAFNFRERANQAAIAQWEGLSDPELIEQIDIIKNRGTQQKGSRVDLEALAEFCRSHDLNIPENLKHVTDQLDVRSLFAHSAMEVISGNTDMTNVRYYRLPGGKWKLLLFDLDLSMYHNNKHPLNFYLLSGRQPTKGFYGELFNALMEVPQMREQYLSLLGKIMAERFSPSSIKERMDAWTALYTPLFEKHYGKWRESNITRWQTEMDRFEHYLILRPKSVMDWLIGAYSLSDNDVETYFGAYRQTLEEPLN